MNDSWPYNIRNRRLSWRHFILSIEQQTSRPDSGNRNTEWCNSPENRSAKATSSLRNGDKN